MQLVLLPICNGEVPTANLFGVSAYERIDRAGQRGYRAAYYADQRLYKKCIGPSVEWPASAALVPLISITIGKNYYFFT